MNIIIVGAGQLGSRHLQGILSSSPLEQRCITVVDISESSLKLCEERANEIDYDKQLTSISYNRELPQNKDFDIAIMSTSASVRASLTKALLEKNAVQCIIFEKVLFQSINEYDEVSALLKSKGIDAYVNCPRRYYDHYRELAGKVNKSMSPLNMKVVGNNWGLACNGIHFLDLFSYLCESNIIQVESDLSQEIIESKRSGYKEVMGSLSFTSKNGDKLVLECTDDATPSLQASYLFDSEVINVDELSCCIYEHDNRIAVYEPIFQSHLTGAYIKEFEQTGKLSLTNFEESNSLHKLFINVLLEHFVKNGLANDKVCPIT